MAAPAPEDGGSGPGLGGAKFVSAGPSPASEWLERQGLGPLVPILCDKWRVAKLGELHALSPEDFAVGAMCGTCLLQRSGCDGCRVCKRSLNGHASHVHRASTLHPCTCVRAPCRISRLPMILF